MSVYIVKYENMHEEWAQKRFHFICYLLFLKKKVWIKNGKMLRLKK